MKADAEHAIRALMHRNNMMRTSMVSLARHFHGEVGRTIVSELRWIDEECGKYERELGLDSADGTVVSYDPDSSKEDGEANGNNRTT